MTEQAAAAATGDATQALQYAFEKLGEMAQHYGPKAVDIAASVTQADAVASLAEGGVVAVFAAGLLYAAHRLARRAVAGITRDGYDATDEFWVPAGIVGGGFTGITGAILAIVAVCTFADAWTWIALFNPKLALAHEVMKAIAGHAA